MTKNGRRDNRTNFPSIVGQVKARTKNNGALNNLERGTEGKDQYSGHAEAGLGLKYSLNVEGKMGHPVLKSVGMVGAAL